MEEEEAAGTYNKMTMMTAHPLPKQYYELLTDFYRANVSYSENPMDNATEQILDLQSDSGVMSHWKDYHKLAVYTYLSHQAAAPFSLSGGGTVHVPMIPQVGVFRIGRLHRLNCIAVQLPLETRRVYLVLLMPDTPEGIDEMLATLPKEKLLQMVNSLPLKETEVMLPQLAILSSDLDFGPFLRQLGIRQLFTNSNSYVRSIKQNAYFSTSFVAINSVGSFTAQIDLKPTSRPKREASVLTIDKSFLFFLIHRQSEVILLAGAVQNPTQVPYPS